MKKFSHIYFFVLFFFFLFSFENSTSQISYQNVSNKNVSLGSYGRVGVDWSFENGGSIGRRLNLNNMGSIGGRLEEQDYLELAPAFHWSPKDGDETNIHAQVRFAMYSNSLSLFGNSSTTSLGGLTLSVPEIFVEARNIKGKELSIWVGSRLYRGPDVHIADHFYFNDHGGQGFGVEYKKTRFATIFVSSTDTTSTVPPYFYLNIKTGTPSAELRQRTVMLVEQDFDLNEDHKITLLGEYHRMADAGYDDVDDPVQLPENPDIITNFPSDDGFVFGARLTSNLKNLNTGSFNDFTIRYGSGIANGGDGGVSKTWATFGAPDLDKLNFNGAYSWAFVDHAVFNFSDKYALNAYGIMTASKGGAATNGLAKTYFGREVYNKKFDLTVGVRNEHFISDYFHLLTELHYSQRTDGDNPVASMTKFSIAPVLVPTGERDVWARPHLRFVASAAYYNDYAKESLYSPYLQFAGEKQWGYYFGVKAEWWVWN
ncbi:MAG: hypothetical protein BM563_00300 [Bacteroidetes bacterium MedPE-SWsnd-G1]|nr:MAG: hypothetical protein BM563_00300 [Bacteroidetes bacterium MedPE-SWsnd-G1]